MLRFRLFVSNNGDSSVPVQRQRWHPSETDVLVSTIIGKMTGMEVANRQAAGRLMVRNLLDIEERLRPFAEEMEEKMVSLERLRLCRSVALPVLVRFRCSRD